MDSIKNGKVKEKPAPRDLFLERLRAIDVELMRRQAERDGGDFREMLADYTAASEEVLRIYRSALQETLLRSDSEQMVKATRYAMVAAFAAVIASAVPLAVQLIAPLLHRP